MNHTSNRLVPELTVTDLARSLAFWRDLVGFRLVFDRPEEGFASLERDGAEVMLDQYHPEGRHWLVRPYEPPLGNGINLQIEVAATAPVLDRLRAIRSRTSSNRHSMCSGFCKSEIATCPKASRSSGKPRDMACPFR